MGLEFFNQISEENIRISGHWNFGSWY